MTEGAEPAELTASAVRIGELEKLGAGREAELFLWPHGGVVKLFRTPGDAAAAQREAACLALLRASGAAVPRLLGTVTIEQRPGVVMERLVGPDQLQLIVSRPWTMWKVAESLARLHAQLHAGVAPERLPSLKATLRQEIAQSGSVPPDVRARALAELDRLADGVAVCHWDFHPGNVIETAAGPRVIDWGAVHRGQALADVARTLILIGGGAPPDMPPLVRKLIAIARAVVSRRYLREYSRLRPFDPDALQAWLPVVAAARLAEGIPEERDYLLGLVQQAGWAAG